MELQARMKRKRLGIKSTEIKNAFDRLIDRLDIAEERSNHLEDKSTETSQAERQRKKEQNAPEQLQRCKHMHDENPTGKQDKGAREYLNMTGTHR